MGTKKQIASFPYRTVKSCLAGKESIEGDPSRHDYIGMTGGRQ
jgi:hypothetical protein